MLKIRVLPLVVAAFLAQSVQADSESSTPNNDERRERLEAMKAAAAGYQLYRARDRENALTLLDDPILRYSDEITKVPDGTLFVWTHHNRPEAILCIWYHPNGSRYHEFQSLSHEKLIAERNAITRWHPSQPGVTFKPLADSPPPAQTQLARLRQLRNMAREFSASVIDLKYGRHELRLMPQPIFRYGRQGTELLDGAIFAFSKGTNPEVLLLFEALPDEAGNAQWHFAPARMTSREIDVVRSGASVWKQPLLRGRESQQRDGVYSQRVLR